MIVKNLFFVGIVVAAYGGFFPQGEVLADSESKSGESPWGTVREGFRLALRTTKASVVKGEKVEILFVLQNVDSKPYDILRVHPVRVHEIEVTGPDGKPVVMTQLGKRMSTPSVEGPRALETLLPKEESSYSLNLGEIFDFSATGKYQIRASRKVPTLNDPSMYINVTSNKLAIEVKAAIEKDKK